MNQAVVAFDPSKFGVAIANMAKAGPARVGFLKMSKDGVWSFGIDDEEIDAEQRVYIDPNGFVHGWQLWADTDIPGVQSELLGEVVAPLDQPRPLEPQTHPAPAKGGTWRALMGLSAVFDGRPLRYTTTSYGGLAAFKALGEAYAKHFALKSGPGTPIAVVSLSSESYKHKKYGKLYNPMIEVTAWVAKLPEAQADEPAKPAAKPAAKKAPRKA
jgi:hypothetical protein